MTWRRALLAGCAALACTAAAAQAPPQRVADARPGEVRLLVSNGIRVPLERVRDQAGKTIGRPLVVEYGASRRLQETIESGQRFEIAVLTRGVVEEMVAKGKVLPGSVVDLARVPVGVAMRGNQATGQNVRTLDGLKQALLGAKRIRFTSAGAARPTIDNALSMLGLTEALSGRLDGSGGSQDTPAADLLPGEYELVLTLASEILPLPGWAYLGPIPSQLQVPVVMAAGVGSGGNAQAAQALLAFLRGPAMTPALMSSRMSR